MVTSKEEIAAIRAILVVTGVTQCGGDGADGTGCTLVHGQKLKSNVDGREYSILFKDNYAVINGNIVVFCDTCAMYSRYEVLTLEKAKKVLDKLRAEMRARPAEPTPPETPATTATPVTSAAPAKVAPPPVIPMVGKVQAHMKAPALHEAQPPAQDGSRKGPQPAREERLPPAVASHLAALENARSFEQAFKTGKEQHRASAERRCAMRCCSAKSGQGFVTRDGGKFPLCDPGLRAAGLFCKVRREANADRPFHYYRNEREQAEHEADFQKRRDADTKARADRDAKISKEILAKRFGSGSKDVCALFVCEAPRPRMELRVFDAKIGADVHNRICEDCARTAEVLDKRLPQDERFFSVARQGQKGRPAPRPQRKPKPAEPPKAAAAKPRPTAAKPPATPAETQEMKGDWRQQLGDWKDRVGATTVLPTKAASPETSVSDIPVPPPAAAPVEVASSTEGDVGGNA